MKVSESHLLPLLASNDHAADLYRDLIRATQPATAATPGEFDPQIAATTGRRAFDLALTAPHDAAKVITALLVALGSTVRHGVGAMRIRPVQSLRE